jgi:hypothetical protein
MNDMGRPIDWDSFLQPPDPPDDRECPRCRLYVDPSLDKCPACGARLVPTVEPDHSHEFDDLVDLED